MQFKVPQFIEIEDKLFGPFTFRQFAYLIGGGGLIFIIYKLLPLWIGIFIIIPVGVIAGLLTFYKVNNRPFIYYLEAGFNYLFSSRLYIWKQRLAKPGQEGMDEVHSSVKESLIPTNTGDKIKDLSRRLNN